MGKFTLDSVIPNNNNRMLGVKGCIQSFIPMVAGWVLELSASRAFTICFHLCLWESAGWSFLYSNADSNGSLLAYL